MRERHAWLVLDTARIDLDLSHTTSHDPETGFTAAGNSFPLETGRHWALVRADWPLGRISWTLFVEVR
jgi:hypothetical protein